MLPKPKHLAVEYGAQFKDRSIVDAYQYREPYSAEVFEFLSRLIADEPRVVLDAGCGRGDLARPLLAYVERVDAVDISEAMIETGMRLPGGDDPRLIWIESPVEEAPLSPPYALITAGQSLHWMEWQIVMPRFRAALTPRGYLAIVNSGTTPTSGDMGLGETIQRYSTNRDYQPYDLVEELDRRRLFEQHGRHETKPIAYSQTVEEYVESFHARNGLSRDRMSPEAAEAFDAEMKQQIAPYAARGHLQLEAVSTIIWGKPLQP